MCRGLRNSEPVESEYSRRALQTREVSICQDLATVPALSLMLSTSCFLGFDGETVLSWSHVKDTCTQRSVQSTGSHRHRFAI